VKPWKITASEYLVRSPYINVRRDTCELPDGSTVPDYHVVEEADYGLVFALTDAGEVPLVKQYKHGIGQIMLELPAGFFDPEDADPAAGAMREFREETGYDATWYEYVGSHVRHPSRNSNRGHLVVATGATPTAEQSLDASEAIDVILLPVDEVFQQIYTGQINAVGSVASIYFGYDYLKRTGRA